MGDALDLFGHVSACALPIAFDRRNQREDRVRVPGGVAGHLAQVARPRLGERRRLVEAAEHREEHRPRAVLGTRGPPLGELVHHAHRVVDRPRAEDQRRLQLRSGP
jgi:hypothetical protein